MQLRDRKKRADQTVFPLMVRVAVPEGGFGQQLDDMYAWLDRHVGQRRYAHNADSIPGYQDAMSFHFFEIGHMTGFLAQFEFELAGSDPDVVTGSTVSLTWR